MLTNEQIDRLLSQGGDVLSEDGEKIGSIGQVFVDNDDGQPSWVTVRTGLFGLSESFVPLEGARTEGENMVVPYGKNQVKDAPRIDADHPLEPAEEDRLYEHYQLGRGRTPSEATTDSADFTAAPRTDGYGAPEATRTTGYDTSARTTEDATAPSAPPDATRTGRHGASEPTRTTGYDTSGRPTEDATATTAPQDATRTTGYDTSGRPTDDATTRPQTRQNLGSEQPPAGRARLRKYVTTENVARTVPVQRQEIRIEREPIMEENRDEILSGSGRDDEHEVILYEERVKVETESVPVERVRIGTETVTDEVTVNEEVRKEHIGTEGREESREEGREEGRS